MKVIKSEILGQNVRRRRQGGRATEEVDNKGKSDN